MSLREICSGAGFGRSAPNIHWIELRRAARSIELKWADRPVKPPPSFALDPLKAKVKATWKREGSLGRLPRGEVKWLPHVMFHPEAEKTAWLAQDRSLLRAALRLISERPRSIRSLLHVVLRVWPVELEGASDVKTTLVSVLKSQDSPRIREWRRRVESYNLLSKTGPSKMAGLLWDEPSSRNRIFEDAGLVGDLQMSGFAVVTYLEYLKRVHRSLDTAEYDRLDPSFEVLAPDGKLSHKQHAAAIAEALLLPFVRKDPPDPVMQRIQTFLLTHLNDPRLTRSGWTSVSDDAKEVMLRWMVSATLEDFFRLISKAAQPEHWRYRKAFWSAYHRYRHIARAWVILGDRVRDDALRMWGRAVPDHGRLSGSGDPKHSVLLLHIGNLVVSEWSHSGTCRIWSVDQKSCPTLYKRQYTRAELMAEPHVYQRHHGNVQYTWQRSLAAYIGQQTDIGMMQKDYVVR